VELIEIHHGLLPFFFAMIPLTVSGIIIDCFFWTTLVAPLSLIIDPVLAMAPFFYDGWIEEQIEKQSLLGWVLL
jgi:hypothetical protein